MCMCMCMYVVCMCIPGPFACIVVGASVVVWRREIMDLPHTRDHVQVESRDFPEISASFVLSGAAVRLDFRVLQIRKLPLVMKGDVLHELLVIFVPGLLVAPCPPVIALDFPFLSPVAAFWAVQHQCYCLVGSSRVLARLRFFCL